VIGSDEALMASNHYEFVTNWRVAGTAEEVYEIISRSEDLSRWWPSVYLQVDVVDPGRAGGIGKRVRLFTKGWLPYTLRWEFVVTEAVRPRRLVIETRGDLAGSGTWTFTEHAGQVDIAFLFRIQADKPMLRALSGLLKPVFAANHRWAMARGLESLELELRRRRARNDQERARMPLPPGPTFRRR
jgi:uncharacterized protein YndB with AHSA1/START domain